MYIRLIRNKPQGNAITGRLIIDGRWFCNTLERKGYEILALCYHVSVTMSPKFKRLLPLVQNVPQRSGIRFHRGSKPEHSTGCILVLADNKNDNTDNLRGNQLPAALKENIPCRSRDIDSSGTLSPLSSNKPNIGCRSAAEVENQLTQLLLKTQNDHEEIILEVIDYRPDTDAGYDIPCPLELQQHKIDERRAAARLCQFFREVTSTTE